MWPLWLPCGPSFLSPMAIAIVIAMRWRWAIELLCPGNLHAALTESGSAVERGSPGPVPSTLDLGQIMGWKSMVARESCKVQFRHMESTWNLHGIYLVQNERRFSYATISTFKFLGTKLGYYLYYLFQGGVLRSPQRDVPSSLWALLRAHLWEICTALARIKV